MNKFLETHNLPRLNDEKIRSLNIQIISKEIESTIATFPSKRNPEPDGFTGELHQDAEKAPDKIQYPFMIKMLNKLNFHA
jgi:hypothetical protein